MLRLSLLKSSLPALFLCLCVVSVPAQEFELSAPPVPEVMPEPPPDPDTFPQPPELEWTELEPNSAVAPPSGPTSPSVPPPALEAFIPPPPPPEFETAVEGLPSLAEIELAQPNVEIWRDGGKSPQIPERQFNQLKQAYVTGTEPVVLRVQFDPLAAGKQVFVKAGNGLTLNPEVVIMTVSSTGECIVSAQLGENLARSHIIFSCEGVTTILPVVRASVGTVEQAEAGQ